jgi:hypothetical protein
MVPDRQVRLFLQEVRNAAHDSTISRDDEDDEDNEAPLAKRPNFDRKKFNSELHQELMFVSLWKPAEIEGF